MPVVLRESESLLVEGPFVYKLEVPALFAGTVTLSDAKTCVVGEAVGAVVVSLSWGWAEVRRIAVHSKRQSDAKRAMA